jgi:hypothetical protein
VPTTVWKILTGQHSQKAMVPRTEKEQSLGKLRQGPRECCQLHVLCLCFLSVVKGRQKQLPYKPHCFAQHPPIAPQHLYSPCQPPWQRAVHWSSWETVFVKLIFRSY